MTTSERRTVEELIGRLEAEASSLRRLLYERDQAVGTLGYIAKRQPGPNACHAAAETRLRNIERNVPMAPPEPAKEKPARPTIVEWLEERFRERQQWPADEIKRAAREAGFNIGTLWSPEVNALPIHKRRWQSQTIGIDNRIPEPCWLWEAMDGWPGPAEGGAA